MIKSKFILKNVKNCIKNLYSELRYFVWIKPQKIIDELISNDFFVM